MNEFLDQFLIECRELAQQATQDLLVLEQEPRNREKLDSVFRGFHTLKGAAGIVEFPAMGKLLHAAEDVLGAVRQGQAQVTTNLIGACVDCLDQVTRWLDAIEAENDLPVVQDGVVSALIVRLERTGGREAPVPEPVVVSSATGQVEILPPTDRALAADATAILLEQARLLADAAPETFPGVLGAAGLAASRVLANDGHAAEAQSVLKALAQSQAAGNAAALIAAVKVAVTPPPAPSPPPETAALPAANETTARGLRVPVERIDALVKLTSELTVVKNALGHLVRLAQDGADTAFLAAQLKTQHALMDRHVAALQRSVVGIRVLPLRHVFQRFPRLVREMAQTLGKPVRLEIEGDTTEADKAVVEALFEPLLHAVRNAIDHGIESPEDRQAHAKPPTGRIGLRAAREGDRIMVEVTDDGRGIDTERIRKVAERRGLATADVLARMDDEALAELLFAPGFSTAETVTDLSGRGVGMDAVRTAVARLGGQVAIRSRPGEGSTVLFTLPFTIMISRLLTAKAAGQTFGIPLEAVLETVRVGRRQIAAVGAAKAFVLRDRTMPLIDLAETLNMSAPGTGATAEPQEVSVVVIDVAGQIGAIAVDCFGERLDVLMKPAEGLLAGVAGIAGTTLLGDGSVLIVLDLQALLA